MTGFDDLLAANHTFASTFNLGGFDGVAHAGVALVTCMDSRIDPLGMIGLRPGDAKILRNPGGRVTDEVIDGLVLAVHVLRVERILIVPHTRCTMASYTDQQLRDRISAASGVDASWQSFATVPDQLAALDDDVARLRAHPLIPDRVLVAGFVYDVDTGLLAPRLASGAQ